MNGKILKKYFFEEENSLYFSIIKFIGDFFNDELIGF